VLVKPPIDVDPAVRPGVRPTPNQTLGSERCSRVNPDRIEAHADFTAFAEACQLRMVRSAYLICGDRHLAEDLVQTALVKVAMRWHQVRDGQPEAYLRTILYRDAVSWWRRERREIPVADPPDPHRPHDGTEPVALRIVFAQALARLTRKQRAILVLRFFEDRTEAHTAEILGIAVGTVKSQTVVALRRLRALAPELSDLIRQGSEGGQP
jgi:RNA polymerase sigma-70 factor (sigma-E family)